MTDRRLLLHESPTNAPLTTDEFLWRRKAAGPSSFHVTIDPDLRRVGEVPWPNQDMVALAAAVFLSDRTVKRPKSWEREIDLAVPVRTQAQWQSAAAQLEGVLGFLTSDRWTLSFSDRVASGAHAAAARPDIDLVSLFSGGADSLCGAIEALTNGRRVLLVSHWDWTVHARFQRRLASWLSLRFPDQVKYRSIRLGRAAKQPGVGRFSDEATRRSRSLLFIALGAAFASIEPQVPLWIPENGYASLNPPLAGERRASLSTRTTHPVFLHDLAATMHSVGAYTPVSNPFAALTKGEMFRAVAGQLGDDEASKLLSLSHSCAHVRWAAGTGMPPQTQCGVCFGCLVRRAAFFAGGVQDRTQYLHVSIAPESQPPHIREGARSEVRTVRYAVGRGLTEADIIADGLPMDGSLSLEAALDVARRGLNELGDLVSTAADLARVP